MREDEKLCAEPGCGKPLSRKAGETSQNWRKRRYCDKVCAAKHVNARLTGKGRARSMAARIATSRAFVGG